MNTKPTIKPSKMYAGTIQLRTKKCKDFAIRINVDGMIIQEEKAPAEFTNSTNTYFDAERARKLAFALLSAANKVDRTIKKMNK